MQRRQFLRTAAAAGGGACISSRMLCRLAAAQPRAPLSGTQQDGYLASSYHAPEWLRYSRGVLFDGYSPPIYPHLGEFSAQRLVQATVNIGADLLRFQPIGYWAYYSSKVFPVHEELRARDLINEVAEECRRSGIHHYCYTGDGFPLMLTAECLAGHPEYSDWTQPRWQTLRHLTPLRMEDSDAAVTYDGRSVSGEDTAGGAGALRA